MRPEIWLSQGLSKEVFDACLWVEQNVSFRRYYLLNVLDEHDLLVIEVVPVFADMAPCVREVMSLSHGAFMVSDCEQVIHWLFSLWRGHVRRQVQVMRGEVYLVFNFQVLVTTEKLEPFEADYQNWGQFPNVYLLDSWLMLLAFLTIPLVLIIQLLLLGVLRQTVL